MLVVQELDDGLPGVAVVHVVAKAGCIDDCKSDCGALVERQNIRCIIYTLEELLLQFCLCDFNLDSFVDLLCVPSLVIGIVLDRGGEERVDESCLSEPRLASNLDLT